MHELKLIKLYCYVCEQYNHILRWNVQRFSPNQLEGQITDEEIITIYLFCLAYEEKYKVKSMHEHIQRYWLSWFPKLPAYQTFNDRLNRLADAFNDLVVCQMQGLNLPQDSLPILLGDSFPIITCSHKRAGKVAPNLTDKGYCATKNLYYIGLKIHALALRRVGSLPLPKFLGITPASVHDLTALRPVLQQTHAIASILDKAYCDTELQMQMAEHGNELITPIKEKRGKPLILRQIDKAYMDLVNTSISKVRQPIESLFNYFNERTHIQNASKVRSEKGLLVHVFGHLAAALLVLANF